MTDLARIAPRRGILPLLCAAGIVAASACSEPAAGTDPIEAGPAAPPPGPEGPPHWEAGFPSQQAQPLPAPQVSIATELGLTRYSGQITPQVQQTDADLTTYRFDPTEGPMCLRGGQYYTTVRDARARDLVIFLQDGGVCWSQFCLAVNKARVGMPRIDILDPHLTSNPVADWNHVFAPYCDGSFFSGDAVHADNLNNLGTRHHRGLANVTAALEVAKMRFPDPGRLLLAGSSGGAYGLLLAGFLARHYYPDAELILVADSGIGIARDNQPAYLASILDEFKLSRFIPADCAGCTDRGHLTGLLGYLLDRDPQVRVGMYSSWYDPILAKLYLQIPATEFAAALRQQTARLRAAHPDRFRRFITDGIQHTALPGKSSAFTGTDWGALEVPPGALWTLLGGVKLGNMENTRIGALTFAAWLKGLIDNDTRAWVDILEPQGSPP